MGVIGAVKPFINPSAYAVADVDGQASVMEAKQKWLEDPNPQTEAAYYAAHFNALAAETAVVPGVGAVFSSIAIRYDIASIAAGNREASDYIGLAGNAAILASQGVSIFGLDEIEVGVFTAAELSDFVGALITTGGANVDSSTIGNYIDAGAKALGLQQSPDGGYQVTGGGENSTFTTTGDGQYVQMTVDPSQTNSSGQVWVPQIDPATGDISGFSLETPTGNTVIPGDPNSQTNYGYFFGPNEDSYVSWSPDALGELSPSPYSGAPAVANWQLPGGEVVEYADGTFARIGPDGSVSFPDSSVYPSGALPDTGSGGGNTTGGAGGPGSGNGSSSGGGGNSSGGGDGGGGGTTGSGGDGGGAGGSASAGVAGGLLRNGDGDEDPLVLDLKGSGINLTQLTSTSTMFDMTSNGFANRTSWVGEGSALLVVDPNGVAVTSASQLVTSFAELAAMDSNGDGVIDVSDPAYQSLKVWVGSSLSGMAEGTGTLMTLAEAGIASIGVGSTSTSETINGNAVTAVGSFTLTSGATQTIAAVDFDYSTYVTAPDTPVTVSAQVSALPTLAGSGTLYDLHSAMMNDATLMQQVESLADTADTNAADLEAAVQAAMFEWAGVTNVDPASRGFRVSDARKLEFVERYLGQSFVAADVGADGNKDDPGLKAADDTQLAWNALYSASVARLVLQSDVGATVLPEFGYNTYSDVVYPVGGFGQAMSTALARLGAPSATNWSAWDLEFRAGYAAAMDAGASQMVYEKMVSDATSDEIGSLANAVASGLTVQFGANGQISEEGTSVSDILYAGPGVAVLNGNGGGANYETPGLIGDSFVYSAGDGQLELVESEIYGGTPSNILYLESINESTVKVGGTADGYSIVLTDGVAGDEITIDNMRVNSADGVQKVVFADGTQWTAQQLIAMSHHITGTPGNDTLTDTSGADLFDGNGGNDLEQGIGGNDTFVFNGGYGQLEINEWAGDFSTSTAVLSLGAGIDASQISVTGDASGDIILTDGISGDRIQLDSDENLSIFGFSSRGVGAVQFADGTVWTAQQLITKATTGSAGNDTLYGSGGSDVFDGLGGADLELGNGGADTFIFNPGYGHLEINERAGDTSNSAAVLALGAGIAESQVSVTGSASGAITLTDGVSGDSVVVDAQENQSIFGYRSYGVGSVQFADGTVWTAQQLIDHATTGTTGDDTLYGSAGADIFDGRGGSDLAVGQGGADTFNFDIGSGQVEIDERAGDTTTTSAVLSLGAGINESQIKVTGSASGDITLTDGVSGDSIQIDGQENQSVFGDSSYGVGSVQFADGTVWSAQQLVNHATTGTGGNDTLYGSVRADLIDGGGGNDVAVGGGGSDTFVFQSGYGQLEIDERADIATASAAVLSLGAGIAESQVYVTSSVSGNIILTDEVSGDRIQIDGQESQSVYGRNSYGVGSVQFADGTVWTAQQLIDQATTGTTGDDTLYGSPGADVFDGRGGNDVAMGNGGDDTFVFNEGYGQLEISESAPGQNPVLELGDGITASSLIVQWTTDRTGLVISDGVIGDQIVLDDMVSDNSKGVQSLQFADGTTLSRQQLLSLATTSVPSQISGTSGADTLNGTAGDDLLDGKGGDDYVVGNGGNDTFVFDRGYGELEVNSDYWDNQFPVLQFGSGITASDLQVRPTADGSGLVLTDGTLGDQITIDRMITGNEWGVTSAAFADGSTLTAQQLIALETTGSIGNDTLYGTTGADVFDGKGGSDLEIGNGGNDTFVFDRGYGQLEINSSYWDNQFPVLEFGEGITAADLQVRATADGNGLVLTDGTSGDQITIDRMITGNEWGVTSAAFADGSTLTAQQLIAMSHQITGTPGNDTLTGTSGADLFDGKGGNDLETGNGGNDTFVFDRGYGQLEINSTYWDNSLPVLEFGEGITAADLQARATADGSGLVLTDGTSGDQITIDRMIAGNEWGVTSAAFADGSTLTAQQLVALETTGSIGNDTLYGTTGADVFDGKGGSDVEIGNGGSDTFVFNASYGALEVRESFTPGGATPVLQFGNGISESSISVTSSDGNIIIGDGIAGDQVIIDAVMASDTAGIEQVKFADGTTLSRADLVRMATTGTSGNDSLYGSIDDDVIDGKGGNDFETGRGGNDTFVFNAGYGNLEINNGFGFGQTPIVQFGAGISASSLEVTFSGAALILKDGIEGDQITIDSMETSSMDGYGVTGVQFADGSTLSAAQLVEMSHQIYGTSGSDTLNGSNGDDHIDGRGGDDYEVGYGGNDTFVFNAGYGNLTINEGGSSNAVLQLGAGISESSLQVSINPAQNYDMTITDGVPGDQLTIYGEANSGGWWGVEEVEFADGTTMTRQQLINLYTTGTSGNDTIVGTPDSDVFDGKGGNDVEIGNGGNDTYKLAAGYGALTIQNGVTSNNTALGDLAIAGSNPDNVWLQQVGNDLEVSIMGTGTEATIAGWFSNSSSQLSELTLAGGSGGNMTLDTQLGQLVQAMASFSAATPGFDPTLPANSQITDPTLLAAVNSAWHQSA